MSKRSKRAAALIVPVLAVVAVVVGLVVQSSTASSKKGRASNAAAASNAQMHKAFAVLHSADARMAAVTSQPLPASVLKGLSDSTAPYAPSLDPSEASYAGGTYPTWVVPGTGEVCLVVGAIGPKGVPSSSCGTSAEANAGEVILLTETATGAPLVFGLAPDTNSTVTVTEANGTTRSVPVTNNVYEITSGTPSSVSLKTTSGATTTESAALPPRPANTAPAGG